jgi:hypothetical protein
MKLGSPVSLASLAGLKSRRLHFELSSFLNTVFKYRIVLIIDFANINFEKRKPFSFIKLNCFIEVLPLINPIAVS